MRSLSILIFLFSSFFCLSQPKHDYVWLTGYGEVDSIYQFGGSRINFNTTPPALTRFSLPEKFGFLAPFSMSDSAGNLIFYTNGCRIINYQHQLMENGDNINPGPVHDDYCNNEPFIYDDLQGLLCVPFPNRPSSYILFHAARQPDPSGLKHTVKYFFSEIDMNANNGLGEVIRKNEILIGPDTLLLSTTAVRHGNGRDWWVMVGRRTTNVFYTFLVDPQGVHGPYEQDWQSTWIPGQQYERTAAFSPDGRWFTRVSNGPVPAFILYHFDRCTGQLYDPMRISIPDESIDAAWPAFSPNSRYLYVANRALNLFQYDTQAPNISASAQLIGEYDGFQDSSTIFYFATSFHCLAPAPNGKIYMATGNGTLYLHTIHQPDRPGTACDFRQHDVELPTYHYFMLPNFPNYRLLDLPGSPCDTLGISPAGPPGVAGVRLSPNPATVALKVEWPAGAAPERLLAYDALGRLVFAAAVPDREAVEYVFSVETWPAGAYWLRLEGGGAAGRALPFVVAR